MAFINHKEPSVNNRHRTNGVCVGFIITCPGFHSLHMIVRKERQLQDDRSAALPDIATVSVGGDEGMGQKISQAQVAVQRFRIDGSRRFRAFTYRRTAWLAIQNETVRRCLPGF